MKITLYARSDRNQNGKLYQEKIDLSSQHPYRHYAAYDYCLPHCSSQQKRLQPSIASTSNDGYTEYLVRARRCIAFADTAELKPIKINPPKHEKILNRLRTACRLDHTTLWTSPCGTRFILIEPYQDLERSPHALTNAGFIYITVPESLSPYCGSWDQAPGTHPRTKSYLICAAAHQAKLVAISNKLQTQSGIAPNWNDLVGVSYV